MKKALLLIFIYLITFTVYSQEYHPMIVVGNQWNVMTKFEQDFNAEPENYWFTTKYEVGQEIIQNDTVYHEIVDQNGERVYLVWEDTESEKVYFDNQLMYDFSLEVNDTFSYFDNYGDILYSLRLDSIRPFQFENEKWTRIYHLSYKQSDDNDFQNYGHTWIEGMGSFKGLNAVKPILVGNQPFDQLLCFKNSDISLYTNSDFETCDENSTAISHIEIEEIAIYPNPVSDNIHLDLPFSDKEIMIRIVDVLGQTVYKNQKVILDGNLDIDISYLENGLYFISLYNDLYKNYQYLVGNFVVK